MNFNVELPEMAVQRIAVKLTPKAERAVKSRHPWIFDKGIKKQSIEGKSGDLAIIFDSKKNNMLAIGLFDPDSPIRIKIIQFFKGAKVDAEFFKQRIEEAYNLRVPLLRTKTNSYRLLYGENDGFPGLIVDVYDHVIVVKLYSAIWFPYLKEILPTLIEVTKCDTMVYRQSRVLARNSNESGFTDGQVLLGELTDEVVPFNEHGVQFSANVIRGHKTGYFLDHRHNRKRVGELAKGKSVLDVFSYAGGFSVHALVGGAKRVTSLDISKQALEVAAYNASLNTHKGTHETMCVDAFEGLQELIKNKQRFDIVVIDPPSFAKQASEIEGAKNSYKRLTRLGMQLVKKGGLLVMASCSSRVLAEEFFDIVESQLLQHGKSVDCEAKTYHDIDHPISFPEGAYLKCGYYRL